MEGYNADQMRGVWWEWEGVLDPPLDYSLTTLAIRLTEELSKSIPPSPDNVKRKVRGR